MKRKTETETKTESLEISKEDIKKYLDYQKEIGEISIRIKSKITSMLKILSAAFNKRIYMDTYSPINVTSSRVYVRLYNSGGQRLKTDKWEYNEGIPIKFLMMTNEEIAEHLRVEIGNSRENEQVLSNKKKLFNERLREARKKIKEELGLA